MKKSLTFLIPLLLEGALQISGYQNPTLSKFLLGVALFLFVIWFLPKNMIPFALITIGVILIVIGTIWLYRLCRIKATVTDIPNVNPTSGVYSLAQTCQKLDATYTSINRRTEVFIPEWINALDNMRSQRSTYDLFNLFQVWGRIPVGLTAEQLMLEANFAIGCLQRKSYLQTETTGKQNTYWGIQFENKIIKFSDTWGKWI